MGCSSSSRRISNEPAATEPPTENENEEAVAPQYCSFQQFIADNSPNPRLFEFLFRKEIGRGAMSRVYLIENVETHDFLAAKVYNKRQLDKQTFGNEETLGTSVAREIKLMSEMRHRYILEIIEEIDFPDANAKLLLMPFASSGTLQMQLSAKTITTETLAICFHQVAEGMRYIHSLNIVHRDLKPDNILCFSDDFFVISDFSASSKLDDDNQMLEDTKGSPAFLSPEECGGKPIYPKPADVWAYGISLYASAFNVLPFSLEVAQGKNVATTVLLVTEMLEKESLSFPADQEIDGNLKELIEDTLQKDPSKRPTFEKIVKYEFFRNAWPIDEKFKKEEEEPVEQ